MMAFHHQSPPHTFVAPPIPFTSAIPGGLLEGTTVTINGRVLPGADRFHVNFQCGAQANADVAFHFNPRFDSFLSYVVANTSRNSQWETEQRQENLSLSACSSFSLTFTVRSHAYQVNVNGNLFMEYQHRIPFLMVNTISVGGKVEVSSISFQNPAVPPQPQPFPGIPAYPYPFPTSYIPPQAGYLPAVVPQPPFPSFPAYPYPFPTSTVPPQAGYQPPQAGYQPPQAGYQPAMFPVPYQSVINGGLHPGRTITIQGVVNPSAKRFNVNLNYQSGVALHYNPRFDENTVVRNSKHGSAWGSEERHGGMPFKRGQPFTLTVCCEAKSFRIVVNGNQAHTYNHRHTILRQINMMEIGGDVSLTSVSV